MNYILKNALGWVMYFVVMAGLIYGIPKAMSAVLKTPYPLAAITSGSMWPVLKTGDLVLIQGVKSKDDIKIGDIIVYRNQIGFTIHRVIKMNEKTVVTKGDANNINDNPVEYFDVIGKAVTLNKDPFRIPMLGKINMMFNRKKI
jgi:signal peptidase I